jgi:hypothetical protein
MILLLDEQATKYRSLNAWFKTFQGQCVGQAFALELMPLREQLKGRHLIQLGHCGDNPWLPELAFQHRWVVSPCNIPQKTSFLTSLTALPIERDSIDCVLAPLTLEAFSPDKNPLDEIDRILKPMGHVIFFGVNPLSLWGLCLYLRQLACFGQAHPNLTTFMHLKRAMLHRGYHVCALTSFYYIPPVSNESIIRRLAFLNAMGKIVWPFPAGFYCLILQKYQYCWPSLLVDVKKEEALIGTSPAFRVAE